MEPPGGPHSSKALGEKIGAFDSLDLEDIPKFYLPHDLTRDPACTPEHPLCGG